MISSMRKLILDLMKDYKVMTIATVRPDGYPQATAVTYANDALRLYFCCDGNSRKVHNIARDRKVSLTINDDNWKKIRGLSLGGAAHVVSDRREYRRALKLLAKKFPQMAGLSEEDMKPLALVRITPKVISVLDYTNGFGHTDLVKA